MVQFKRVLTGEEKREYTRAVDAQPVLRVQGSTTTSKRWAAPAAPDPVRDARNWSFGDYFKREAIHWAWEFLTVELGIPGERIAATTYLDDEEARRIWTDEIGLPPERMATWGNIAAGDDHNFWSMGEGHGPCGPCSELHYDRGAELSEGRSASPIIGELSALARDLEPGLHAVRPIR